MRLRNIKFVLLFVATSFVFGCAKESRARKKVATANGGFASPPGSAQANVEKFCDFSRGRCDDADVMVWELRLRLAQINDYARTAPPSARFLDEWSARYRAALARGEARLAKQSEFIEVLNRDFGCHVRRFGDGEQMTFGRELSATGCQPLRATDPVKAASTLRALAQVSLASEAPAILSEAALYEDIGPLVSDLAALGQEILNRGILYFDPPGRGHLKAAHIGHPFERLNEVRWLKAYAYNVRRLSKRYGDLTQSYRVACLEPACDPEIFKVAEAADFYPPLDWGFLRDGDRVVAPAPYALSYFGQRYSANVEIREALGLNLQRSWLWNSEHYQSQLRASENTLNFARMFPKEGISLTIADYRARTEYTNVLPLFLSFQEARGVLDVLLDLRKQELLRLGEQEKRISERDEQKLAADRPATDSPAENEEFERQRLERRHQLSLDLRAQSKILRLIESVHELRFDRFNGEGYVALEPNEVGQRLSLRVLSPKEDRPIAEVRGEIHREIPVLFRAAADAL